MANRHYSTESLKNAKNLRLNQTDAENMLWFNLRNKKLAGIKFRRQVPIGQYIVDFLCCEKKLIVELDGSQHIDNIKYDRIRTEYLNSLGYKVIRIYNNEIFSNIETVLEYIYQSYTML